VLGRRLGDALAQAAHDGIDRVLGHDPVGRVLAARHGDEPGDRGRDGVLAAQLRRVLRLALEQRAQPGEDAFDVVVAQRHGEHGVGALEDVVDVGPRGGGVELVQTPVRVGRAQEPVPAPGDDEQDAGLRPQDHAGVQLHPVARHDEVHALRRAHAELPPLADQALHVVGPHARGVDHLARGHLELIAGRHVPHAHAGHATGLAQEPYDLGVGDHDRAVVRGRAGDLHGVAGVVELGVPILDRPDERVAPEPGREPQRLAAGEVAVVAQALEAAQAVVEQHARPDVGALPAVVGERVEERDRPHQVWREHVEQEAALLERLAHEAELLLLEVAQPAVDQLRRAARGPGPEIARLDQRNVEPARGGVQRAARAHDAAADHHHVEGLAGEAGQMGCALLGAEPRPLGGRRQRHRPPAGATAASTKRAVSASTSARLVSLKISCRAPG
jgi:hypothetical protein